MFSSSKRLTYSLYLKYFLKHLIDHLQPNLGGADYMRETSSLPKRIKNQNVTLLVPAK